MDRDTILSLGYQVKPDGTILQEEINEDGKKVWRPFSRIGERRAVLNELSPFATFIASSLNLPPIDDIKKVQIDYFNVSKTSMDGFMKPLIQMDERGLLTTLYGAIFTFVVLVPVKYLFGRQL